MTMRKMLAVLATLAILCTVLPLGAIFSASADGAVILDKNFEDGNAFFTRSVVENGYIVFDATTADWQNTYAYVNALQANTDYTVSFKAKANKDTNMNFKVNDNWGKDAAAVTVDVTTEWQDYIFEINMSSLSTGIVMFSSNAPAASAATYYIDDVKIVEGKIPAEPEVPAGVVIENSTFDDGAQGWGSSSKVSVEDGILVFECTQDWANVYKYANGMKPNTDYVYTFRAKANMNSTMNIKINDNWASDSAHVKFDVTTEWQEFTVDVNSGNFTSAPILMFSVNVPASVGMIFYLDYVTITEKPAGEPETPDEPADDNLIVNGDFETGDASGWETWQSTAIEAAAAKDSAYGAHLIGSGTWGGLLNQTVKVEAGKQYKLSFWINVNAMGVNLQVKDGAGKAIEGAGGWFDANKKDKVVEYTFIAPDNSVLINFCGSGSAPEDVYVDNFSLVCLDNGDAPAEPSNDGYIINGDFETGDIKPWDNLWGSCPKAEIIEGGKDSAYALNVVSKQWNHVRQTNIAVEANTDYKITVWAKEANNMCLLVKNGADTTDIANVGVSAGSEWKEFTVEFNSGEFTSIIFSLMGGEGTDQYGIFDNIAMEKVGGETPDTPDEPEEPEAPAGALLFESFSKDLSDGWKLTTKGTSGIVDGAMKLEGNAYEELLTSPVIALKKGVTYTISFDIKLINKGEINFQVKNCYEDDAGKGVNILLQYIRDAKTDAWTTCTYTFKNEDLARDYASLLFVNHAGTDFYVDNIVVTSDEKPEEPEVPSGDILNATFDSGEFDGILSSSDISVVDGELQFVVSKDWGNVYTGFEVEANTDYEVSFRAKSKLGKTVWAKFHKADWTGDICQQTAALSTSWKDYTYTMNSGDNTYVYLLIQYAGYAAEGETVWFDYITVKKVGGGSEPDAPSGNLIVNGDFETGDASGWETWQSTEINADAAKDGNFGANLIGNGGWGGMLNQTMKVEAGKEYKLSFWIYVVKTGVNLQVKDGAGKGIEGAGGWFDASNQGKVIEWTFVAPDDTVLINFCGSGAAAEDVYVDNFVLEAVEAPAPSNDLVTNGDFETGDASGWETWQSTVVSEEAAKNGKFGVNLIGNGGWGGLLNQTFKVEKGETYVITLWACVNASGANLQIKGADKVEGECDNTYLDANELSGWTERKFTVVANSDEITLNFCGGGTQKAEDLYIDDISVTVKGAGPVVEDTYPIKNAGFETGDLSGGWKNLWDSCTYSFETPGHDKSNYAISIEAPGNWQQIRQDGVPVEPNTDYTLIAYVKNPINFNVVVKTANDSANIADFGVENDMSNTWIRLEVPFNSGEETAVCVLLIGNDQGPSSAVFDNVQIYKKGEEPAEPEPDAPATEGPIQLDSFGVAINRPASPEANLIVNGSFEDAEGGQWQSIIGDTLYVVDDETAPEGNKSLFFNTSAVKESNKTIFYLDVEPNTDYVFSAWVKGAFISDTNRFNATFGVTDWKDNFCVYADAVFSNKTRQIVPTAWDNEWHLRSV